METLSQQVYRSLLLLTLDVAPATSAEAICQCSSAKVQIKAIMQIFA